MNRRGLGETLTLGEWRAERRTCRLLRKNELRKLEPKVMDLLFLLAASSGEVVSREAILGTIWPNVTVNEDTLARCIFKLRRALDDDPRAPRYVETIPKRGYRLVPDLGAADGLQLLKQRAQAFYFQFTRADNEAAMALYERVLVQDANDPEALAGMANGRVQRAVRWSGLAEGEASRPNLEAALASGALSAAVAVRCLEEAHAWAARAVEIAPDAVEPLKALGLVFAAMGRFGEARGAYQRALDAHPQAWGVVINLADLDGLEGRPTEALQRLEQAYRLMAEVYDEQVVLVRPWYVALGAMIAGRHRALGDLVAARDWYLRVLAESPLHEEATLGLAELLLADGEVSEARRLCLELVARTGRKPAFEMIISRTAGVAG